MATEQKEFKVVDGLVSSVAYPVKLTHQHQEGTPAANMGAGAEIELPNAAGVNKVAVTLEGIWTDATSGSEDAALVVKAMTAGAAAAEVARFSGSGIALGGIADIATDRLLGRDTASTGDVETLTVGGGLEFTGSGGIQRSAISGDVTIAAGSGTAAITGGAIVNADINASAAIDASKLANYAALASLVAAGLGNSVTYAKTDSGTKTLLAANASKDRGVLVVVYIDTVFADGDGTQPTIQIGETDTANKCFDTATFTGAAAGAYFVKGFLNTSTKAITATLVAATGTTSTGAYSITVIALPNS